MVDVVVIGAGHNGLVASALLARSGLDVVVFDKLSWPGGMAGYHVLGGAEVGVGAYVVGVMPREVLDRLGVDLEIEVPDPVAVYELDGQYVRWWRDPGRRVEEFKQWGLGDEIAAFWEKLTALNRAARRYFFGGPPSEEALAEDPEAAELVKKTARDVMSQYLPEEFWPMFLYRHLWDEPAFLLAYFNPPEGWGRPVWRGERGIQALSKALYRTALWSGAEVVLGVGVRKIVVERGAVKGVELDTGKLVEARAVLSTASPIHTLLELVEGVDEGVARRLRDAAATAGPYRLNVVLSEQVKLRRGLAPYRDSIFQLPMGEMLVDGDRLSVVGEPDIGRLESYVENLGKVKAFEVWTPADYRSTFNAAGAYVNHLPMAKGFLFSCRPVCGWGYKTPIRGLYLGGAGTWPGGQITGVPGVNAAEAVLRDLSRRP
ncbi:MAG: phytoene desaturase family protein [Thermoproteus sp.]